MHSPRPRRRGLRPSGTAAAVALTVFAGVTGTATGAIADTTVVSDQDTSGPQIVSFSMTPSAVDVRTADATLTATAQLTDDVSGVADVFVTYVSNSKTQRLDARFTPQNRTSGDANSGTYTSSVLVDTQRESGTWTVSGASTKDVVGNTRSYTADEARAFGASDFTVMSDRDATAPTLSAVRWTPNPLDLSTADGAPVFEWDAADEGGSGVQYVNISLRSPSKRLRLSAQGYHSGSTPLSSHTFTGKGVTSTPTPVANWFENGISQYSEPGTWTIDWVQVGDRARNTRTYQGAELDQLLGGKTFVVQADPEDVTAPTVTAYRFSPTSIDVTSEAKTVTADFDVTDDLSGVQAAWITFRSPTITTASPQFLERTALHHHYLTNPRVINGTVSGRVTFPVYDRSGDWTIQEVCVVDRVKRKACYSGSTLTGLGPTSITVVANEAPKVSVTGATEGGTYETAPTVGCSVTDREDTTIPAVQPTVTGPDADGRYTATCTWTDSGGKTTTTTITYTVTRPSNTAPTITVTGVTSPSFELGTAPTPGCDVQDAEDSNASAEAVVDTSSLEHGLGTVAVTCTYTDAGGLTATSTVTYEIVDTVKPSLEGHPTTPANQHGWYRSDVTIDWTATDGNGSGIDPATMPADEAITQDGSAQTRTASVSDYAGNTASATSAPPVDIDRVLPTVTGLSFTTNPKAVGQESVLTAAVTDDRSGVDRGELFLGDDPGEGKGTPVSFADGKLTHSFDATLPAGVYTVGVRVLDKAGNWSTTTSDYLVVYDADGGFVTGGGRIDSSAGSYANDPSATGRASFGFVSKYQKGATVPTGNTEFQFQAGNLNFASTSYEWLVVSGARAQYKGSGTVNGASGYGFLLTATDGAVAGGGGVDKFRIKITKDGAVVYDNLMGVSDDLGNGQALSNGSIVLHK